MEFEKLCEIIANVLDLEASEISEDSEFEADLGADSLDKVEIIMGIEDELGIEIPVEEAEKIKTVGDAANAIKKAVN